MGFESEGDEVLRCPEGTLKEKMKLITKTATNGANGRVVYILPYSLDTADLLVTAIRTGHVVCVWSRYELAVTNLTKKTLIRKRVKSNKVKAFRPGWNGAAGIQDFIQALSG